MPVENSPIYKVLYRAMRWGMAKKWLDLHPEVEVIGITGSVGKTTAKEVIFSILSQKFKTIKTEANYDPIFNLPITALKIRNEKKFVAEMGIDGVGQMDKYLTLTVPRIGVLTRVAVAHTDEEHLSSIEKIISEKQKMLEAIPEYGWAIMNGDDENVRGISKKLKAQKLFVGYGSKNDLVISNYVQIVKSGNISSRFDLNYEGGTIRLSTNLLGKHNALIASLGVAVGMVSGMDFKDIQKGLLDVKPVEHRLNVKRSPWGYLIDDTYNASPVAVEAGIDVLVDFRKNDSTLVLGQMLELGNLSKQSHFGVGEYAAKRGIKNVIAYGENANDVVAGYEKVRSSGEATVAKTKDDIVMSLKKLKPSLVLVKGSHGIHMEKIVERIVKTRPFEGAG